MANDLRVAATASVPHGPEVKLLALRSLQIRRRRPREARVVAETAKSGIALEAKVSGFRWRRIFPPSFRGAPPISGLPEIGAQ